MLKLLPPLLRRAESSTFWLRLLNAALGFAIPFNRPHRFRISELSSSAVSVHIPFTRRNLNHIRGLHACALATGAELASGVLLIRRLDPGRYRLIMKSLQAEFHYQGRLPAAARAALPAEEFARLAAALDAEGAAVVLLSVEVHDAAGNHLCTASVSWHIKPWSAVRTAVGEARV